MKVSLKGGSKKEDKVIAKNDFVDAKAIPTSTISGKIRLKSKPVAEKPVEPAPEVRVNGVPEKEEEVVADVVEEVVVEHEVVEEAKEPETVMVQPVLPKQVEVAEDVKPERVVTTPITFRNEKHESYYETLKTALYDADKYLSLILNTKSCNDQPQARKEIIDFINTVLVKVIEHASTEEVAQMVKTLFGTVVRLDYETSCEEGIYSACMNIVDNRNDEEIYHGVNNISMKVVDDEESPIDYNEEGPSEQVEDVEDDQLTGYEAFSAISMDLSMIFPQEKGKALLIEDGEGYLTVGDNKLLAITKVDDMFFNDVTVISTKLLDNKDAIIQQLSAQMANEAEEITAEDVTVNGVPTAE